VGIYTLREFMRRGPNFAAPLLLPSVIYPWKKSRGCQVFRWNNFLGKNSEAILKKKAG
jgi:hypothetical protein